MSTLATADLGSSDEENDGDYIPKSRPAKKRKTAKKKRESGTAGSGSESGSSSGSSDSDADEDAAKGEASRLRKEAEEAEVEERRKKAAEAFAAFSEAPVTSVSAVGAGALGARKEEMVDVKRERKFAGETIVETVSLPMSHPDAIAFLAKQKSGQALHSSTTSDSGRADLAPTPITAATDASAPRSVYTASAVSTLPAVSAVPPQAAKPAPRGPIKRKPRQSLEQLSAGLSSGKKMTTLEKASLPRRCGSAVSGVSKEANASQSQMDWKSHLASSSTVSDELDTHRRSGGFLEKRDFLDRVGDRRTEAFDSKKAGKR